VALPWPELREAEHQDGAETDRPAGGGGRDPGDLAPTEALLEEGNAHILRHSHVVNALMAGVPVSMIQKQVGTRGYPRGDLRYGGTGAGERGI